MIEKIITEREISGFKIANSVQDDIFILLQFAKENHLEMLDIRFLFYIYQFKDLVPALRYITNNKKPCPFQENHESNSSFTIDDVKQALIKYKETALKDFVNGKDNAINVIFGELKKKK